MQLSSALFKSKLEKIKKIHTKQKFFIFREMELSTSNIKKFLKFQEMETLKKVLIFWIILMFSQKKAFLIFQETETPQKVLVCFRKQNFLIFREAETLKKFRAGSIYEENPLLKCLLYFGEWNFLALG